MVRAKQLILGIILNNMQDVKNHWLKKIILALIILINFTSSGFSQVSAVQFGRNRLQFKKLTWKYYQSRNFNTYFNQHGQELAKYVLQVAEKELPDLEKFVEYSLQRRINIVVYNSYDDKQQTNIGIGIDQQNTGGITKLVNNKMVIYNNANRNDLRIQIRQGIAQVLTENLLFGEDLGQFASNQTLLDLPIWLTDGYIAYAGQNWSSALDDDLKSEILSGKYKNFYQLSFDKPEIAGHAFWFYIEERYKRENVTYLLYLARVYKNLNRATQQVTKKKFKAVLSDFMQYETDKFEKDIVRRRNYPKGSEITSVDIGKRVDYFHFNVNPNKRNGSFAVVKYDKGMYKLLFNDGDEDKVLLKFGVRANLGDFNPNYPMMAWDPKGTRLTVLYSEEGRLKLFVYDVNIKSAPIRRDLTDVFDQVQDMQYMLDNKSVLFSAVKNGHTNIYTYDLENATVKAITNDVYDNLDASFVAFPNKIGIIYSSNRPSPEAKSADTSLPSNHFNIFLVTDFARNNKPELNQITQLTHVKFGNARYPTQYNDNHFTFISDESGVGNRYAGMFTTKKGGLDTLVMIGDDVLRNPSARDVDSVLRAYHKTDVDSIAEVSISSDSSYTFPLTNYASSIRETRIAGDNHQVSELTRQSDEKILYKLKIDDNTLRKRNVNAAPTAYMRKLLQQDKLSNGENVKFQTKSDAKKKQDVFQSEFEKDTTSSIASIIPNYNDETNTFLSSAKLYDYKPRKFSGDYIAAALDNSVLINRYQPYQGGAGPIQLSSSTPLNGLVKIGTSDIMEDYKIIGGYKLSTNLKDNTWLFEFKDLKKRLDWGTTFFRNVQNETISSPQGDQTYRTITNLYQLNFSYPFDVTRSLKLNIGYRRDRSVIPAFELNTLNAPDYKTSYGMIHLEYVYDNTLNPAQNIWNGSRYKAYMDLNTQLDQHHIGVGKNGYNLGFDARTYYPIYRNFIWAGRAAGDFSFGSQKLIYYLGGIDNWLIFGNNQKINSDGTVKYKYFNPNNVPAPDVAYAFQSLAVNLRGFIQNSANGNNDIVLNSEFRLPVFTTLLSRPINNAFLRNFQVTQFIDLGTAWNGKFGNIARPSSTFGDPPVQVTLKNGGIGPFLGGYGFGARSTLFGYFIKSDVGWPMIGLFKGKPILYFSLGLDF
ncbi:MAG: hypothetical protein NVSMB45_01670 [Ginsengibacter sp.]